MNTQTVSLFAQHFIRAEQSVVLFSDVLQPTFFNCQLSNKKFCYIFVKRTFWRADATDYLYPTVDNGVLLWIFLLIIHSSIVSRSNWFVFNSLKSILVSFSFLFSIVIIDQIWIALVLFENTKINCTSHFQWNLAMRKMNETNPWKDRLKM